MLHIYYWRSDKSRIGNNKSCNFTLVPFGKEFLKFLLKIFHVCIVDTFLILKYGEKLVTFENDLVFKKNLLRTHF